MQTNTHDQNLIKVTTTPTPVQAAKPPYDRILLGIDQHAEHLRIVRQLDGAGPQPPQRVYPGAPLEAFIKKQLARRADAEGQFGGLTAPRATPLRPSAPRGGRLTEKNLTEILRPS